MNWGMIWSYCSPLVLGWPGLVPVMMPDWGACIFQAMFVVSF